MKKIRNVPQVLFGGRLKIVFVGRERVDVYWCSFQDWVSGSQPGRGQCLQLINNRG